MMFAHVKTIIINKENTNTAVLINNNKTCLVNKTDRSIYCTNMVQIFWKKNTVETK